MLANSHLAKKSLVEPGKSKDEHGEDMDTKKNFSRNKREVLEKEFCEIHNKLGHTMQECNHNPFNKFVSVNHVEA